MRHTVYSSFALFIRVGAMGVLLSSASRGEWPAFRGLEGTGVSPSTAIPTQWSETENVRWFSKTEGLGWSSPVIVGNGIYFTTAITDDSKKTRLCLVCHDLADGKQRWIKEVFPLSENAPEIHRKNSHASPTPLHHQGKLFLHFGHEGTACADLEGNLIWISRDHPYKPTHGSGSSPVLVDGLLILTCDGAQGPFTLALDAQNGKEIWKQERGVETNKKFSFCTPAIIEVQGKKQIVSPGADIVQGLDPKTGEILWFVRYTGYSLAVQPLYVDGIVYMSTGFDRAVLLAIDPTGRGDVTQTHVRWQHKSNAPKTPSLIHHRQSIIMVSDDGIATCLNAKDGSERWRKRVGGNHSASPLLAGDRIYFQAEEGEALVYKLEDEPTEIARNKLPGRIFACYAVHENDLIIRSEHGIYRIGNR